MSTDHCPIPRTRSVFPRTFHRDHMQTSSPRLGPNAAGSRGARDNAHVVTLIQEALCSGDARCVVEAVEKACRLKGLPVPHELYGEMTLESLIAVMAAIGLDLRTQLRASEVPQLHRLQGRPLSARRPFCCLKTTDSRTDHCGRVSEHDVTSVDHGLSQNASASRRSSKMP